MRDALLVEVVNGWAKGADGVREQISDDSRLISDVSG